MKIADGPQTEERVFSPADVSPEHLVVAFLVKRMASLSKESLQDLASLAPEMARCEGEEEFWEIVETMREILFPELIGEINEGKAGPVEPTKKLKARMKWIGERIRQMRQAAKMTQEKLASESGLPQSHISRLEAGQHSPSHRTLERIAKALGISIGDLDPTFD